MQSNRKREITFKIFSVLISLLILFLIDRSLSLILREDFLNPIPLIRGLEFQNTCEALAKHQPTLGLPTSQYFNSFPPVNYFQESSHDPSELFVSNPNYFWSLELNTDIKCQVPYTNSELSAAFSYRIKTNSRGFRGKDFPTKKPTGEIRIVCMGDSRTFGWGVSEKETFAYLLEQKLKKWNKNVRVISGAVPGYSSLQGLLLLKREVLTWSPDLVISWYGCNDSWPCHRTDQELISKKRIGNNFKRFLNSSYIYLLLKHLKFLLIDSNRNEWKSSMKKRRVPEVDFLRNGLIFVRLLRQINVPVIFISLGEGANYSLALEKISQLGEVTLLKGESLFLAAQKQLHQGNLYPEKYKKLREKIGPHIMNLYPSLDLFVDPAHPNSIGHAVLANALFHPVKTLLEKRIHKK